MRKKGTWRGGRYWREISEAAWGRKFSQKQMGEADQRRVGINLQEEEVPNCLSIDV